MHSHAGTDNRGHWLANDCFDPTCPIDRVKVGDWVRVFTLPSLTADRVGEVVGAYMNFSHWKVDLGDRIHIVGINNFEVITTTVEEALGEDYLT